MPSWCSAHARDPEEEDLVAYHGLGEPGVCGSMPHPQNKSPHQPNSGLLQPLPIPEQPWSHIVLDFVTGLPLSQGHMVIITLDHFSKAAHFIPLAKLPSSKQTAKTLVHQVIRLHGILKDIVSDRGPQFISEVWKAFCAALGATASLSSKN